MRVEATIRFEHGRGRLKRIVGKKANRTGRIPRVAKLMALAIKMESLVCDGVVTDYAELARLGHVSGARISQIMNLLHLAPDIQEAILFLPPVESGKDPITERELRRVVQVVSWEEQKGAVLHLGKARVPGLLRMTGGNSETKYNTKTVAARRARW